MERPQAKTWYAQAIAERTQSGPEWAAGIRRRAADRFAQMDWPQSREEAWRFTDLTPLIESEFVMNESGGAQPDPGQAAAWSLPDAAAELVFVDGQFAPHASRMPEGGVAGSLRAAILANDDAVRRHLDQHIAPADAFVALNAAFLDDGPFLRVPAGCDGGVVHVVHVSTGGKASHPRGLIVLERGAQSCVVETFAGVGGARPYLANGVVEVILEEAARLDYARVVCESEDAYNLGAMRVVQRAGSRFSSTSVTLSGKITRHALSVSLCGEGAETHLRGLYVTDGDQLADNALFVQHASGGCSSRIAYRGILDGRGRSVFTGRVLVERGAQKTDSNQVNNNLLLSDEARVDTKPQLEIFADDVKCTHGATIGQHSEDAIFYLKTRGIDEAGARRMLTCGFAAETLGQLKVKCLKDRLTRAVFSKFGGENVLA